MTDHVERVAAIQARLDQFWYGSDSDADDVGYLLARVAALEAALAPFANALAEAERENPSGNVFEILEEIAGRVGIVDFWGARSVLAGAGERGGDAQDGTP